MINVLIVDKKTLFCHGLEAVLNSSEYITASTAEPVLDKLLVKIEHFHADIALFPIDGFDTTTVRLINLLKKALPNIKILPFMSSLDKDFIIDGLQLRLDGFLLNDVEIGGKELIKYICDLYDDKHVLSGRVAKYTMHYFLTLYKNEKMHLLENLKNHHIQVTIRELDICYLLMKKRNNKEIALTLLLTENSVRCYVSNIYKKIGLNRRVEVVAFLQGILDESDSLIPN